MSFLGAQGEFKVAALGVEVAILPAVKACLEGLEGDGPLNRLVECSHVLAGVVAIVAIGTGAVNCAAALGVDGQKVVAIGCLALDRACHLSSPGCLEGLPFPSSTYIIYPFAYIVKCF